MLKPTRFPASAHDITAFILKRAGPMSTMRLQKLVYYCQAWSLVWDGRPLFPESIQAWKMGPVVRELYDLHRGMFTVSEWPEGDPGVLDRDARDTVNAVLKHYGKMSAFALSELTHSEAPWRGAREGLREDQNSEAVISRNRMERFYRNLLRHQKAVRSDS